MNGLRRVNVIRTRRLRGRQYVGLVAGLVATAVLAGCGGQTNNAAQPKSGSSHGLTTISVATEPITGYAPFTVAIDKGFYKAAGLNVKLVPTESGAEAIPLLLHGSVQFAAMAPLPAIEVSVKAGTSIKFVGSLATSMPIARDDSAAIIARPSTKISSCADLQGLTVAVSGLESLPQLGVMQCVANAGGDPSKVKFVQLTYQSMVAEVQAGKVSAAFVDEPFTSAALAAGLAAPIRHPWAQAFPGGLLAGYAVNGSYLKSNEAVVDKFVKATNQAVVYVQQHPAYLRSLLPSLTGVSAKLAKTVLLDHFSDALSKKQIAQQADALAKFGWISKAPNPADLVWDHAQ